MISTIAAVMLSLYTYHNYVHRFILKMIIGDISVTLNNSESRYVVFLLMIFYYILYYFRLIYKQEYEKFKMFNTIVIMILSILSLIFQWSM